MGKITGYICLQAESISHQFSHEPFCATGFTEFHIITEDSKQLLEQDLKYKIKNSFSKINVLVSEAKRILTFHFKHYQFLLFLHRKHST